jgi:hypothetical protein
MDLLLQMVGGAAALCCLLVPVYGCLGAWLAHACCTCCCSACCCRWWVAKTSGGWCLARMQVHPAVSGISGPLLQLYMLGLATL